MATSRLLPAANRPSAFGPALELTVDVGVDESSSSILIRPGIDDVQPGDLEIPDVAGDHAQPMMECGRCEQAAHPR